MKLNTSLEENTFCSKENHNKVIKCILIYKAAMNNDWEKAKCFFDEQNLDLNAGITYFSQTPLQIAVYRNKLFTAGCGEISKSDYWKQGITDAADLDQHRNIPLYDSARVGNTEAARLLVDKDPEMVIANRFGHSLEVGKLFAVLYIWLKMPSNAR